MPPEWRSKRTARFGIRFPGNLSVTMSVAAGIIIAVSVLLTAVLVIGLFLWAAVKDGQEDRAVQSRLGIRRKTRMGR
jgi:uncharacterized membrane protein (DUF485 family)